MCANGQVLGIAIDQVQGTGKEGNVTEEDLKHFIGKQKEAISARKITSTALAGDEEVPLVGVRHFMVKKMEEAHSHIPHFSYFEQADATRLIQLKDKIKKRLLRRISAERLCPFLLELYPLLSINFLRSMRLWIQRETD